MTSQWTRLAVAVWITAFGLWIPASAPAGDFPQPRSGYQAPDARWRLNPAGQLELTFDPLNNGQSEYGETYTVILNDRAPKMCGDPDGTGRHTWFFTDALMIEIAPVRTQSTPKHPNPGARKERPR